MQNITTHWGFCFYLLPNRNRKRHKVLRTDTHLMPVFLHWLEEKVYLASRSTFCVNHWKVFISCHWKPRPGKAWESSSVMAKFKSYNLTDWCGTLRKFLNFTKLSFPHLYKRKIRQSLLEVVDWVHWRKLTVSTQQFITLIYFHPLVESYPGMKGE